MTDTPEQRIESLEMQRRILGEQRHRVELVAFAMADALAQARSLIAMLVDPASGTVVPHGVARQVDPTITAIDQAVADYKRTIAT